MIINKQYLEGLQSFKTEGEYRDSPSLNYSTLKRIPEGPQCLVEEKIEHARDAFAVGNYVDRWFTDNNSINDIYELEKPKIELNASLNVLYSFFIESGEIIDVPSLDTCVEVARQLKLWDSIKDDEKIKTRITDEFFNKINQYNEKSNKIQLTEDQYAQAQSSIQNIEKNEDALKLISEKEDQFIIPQFKWEFEMIVPSGRIHKFRVMYDLLCFDIKNGTISAIDIKTGAKESHKFGEQFLEYRYDIQGILYYFGLLALRKQHFPNWDNIKPSAFKFLYSPKKSNRSPIIVSLTDTFIKMYGDLLNCGNKKQDGFFKILDDADWYIENCIFDKHRIIAESKESIEIDKLI